MSARCPAVVVLLLVLLCAPALAAPGDRDPGFNNGNGFDIYGQLPYLYPTDGIEHRVFRDVVVDKSKRTLASGSTTFGDGSGYGMVLRYLPDGQRDVSFGPQNNEPGEVRQTYSGSPFVRGLGLSLTATDAVRFGFLTNGSAVMSSRQSSGALEDGYGDHGYGVVALPPWMPIEDSADGPDGSSYFVGTNPDASGNGEIVLVAYKLDADGRSVPYSASNSAIRIPAFSQGSPHPIAAAVDSQNRLVITTTGVVDTELRFVVVRLTPDGALDTTFGTGGQTVFPTRKPADPTHSNPDGRSYSPRALAIAADDSVVVTGASDGNGLYAATVRLTPGGLVDNTFGGPEGVLRPQTELAHGDAIAIQKGPGAGAGNVIIGGSGFGDIVLTRYTTTGQPDSVFGPAGTRFDTLITNERHSVNGMATTSNGKLLVTGALRLDDKRDEGYVARYLLTNPGNEPQNTQAPVMTGVPKVGETLTCQPGVFTNTSPPQPSVVWQRATRNASDGDPGWGAIANPSGDPRKYTLIGNDLGSRVRCLEVSTNADGSDSAPSNSKRVDVGVPANLRAPVTTGIPIVRQRLTCDVGEWSNGPDLTVQWLSDGREILGATNSFIQLGDAERRHQIGCRVHAANDIGAAASDAVANTFLVVQEAPRILRKPVATSKTVGGKATDIELTCSDPGMWDEDYGQYDYRWRREGVEIAGATGKTYSATVDDLGRNLACVVFSTNPVGRSDGAASDGVLVPLPASSLFAGGEIFKAGGFNQVDPTNLLAVSSTYLSTIHALASQRRGAAQIATRTGCAAGAYKNEPLPAFDSVVDKRLSDRQTCGVLLADSLGFNITQDRNATGSYWLGVGTGIHCYVPGDSYRGNLKLCPQLRIDVPPLDPRKPLESATPAEAAALEANQPLRVLWDFDLDGRTDASCDPQAPILRSLYSRGIYKVRAVILSRYSAESGQYDVIDTELSHFPESDSQKGAIREGQPFACKTSLEPPPERALPCVNEVTFGRVHMTGNLCPISARRIPPAEFDGLPPNVRQMLIDQALNAPPDRRVADLMPSTFGDTRVGGLPALPTSVGSIAATQVSALTTLDSAVPASIPDSWKDKLKQVESFKLDQAQRAMDQIYVANGTSLLNGVKMDPIGDAKTMLVPSDAGAAIKDVKQMTVSSVGVATSLGGIPIGDPGKFSTDLTDKIVNDAGAQAGTLLKGANLDSLANSLKSKLDLGPFKLAGDAKVKLNNDGTASIDAWAELPKLLTKPGSKPIRVGVQVNATREGKLSLTGVHMTAPAAYLGGVLIADMALDYDGGGLRIAGKLLFPPLNQGIAINKFRLDGRGNFQELDVDYLAGVGQGISIGPGLFLTKVGGGLSLNPDEVRARATVSAGPSTGGGCPTAGIDAGFTVHFAPDPFFIDATGVVGLVCIPLGNTRFYADSTGLVELTANVNIDIGVLYFSANLHGKLQLPRWQVDLRGEGGIRHVIQVTIKALIGNLGIAGCGRLEVFPETPITDSVTIAAGAGVRFSNGRPPLSYPELVANVRLFSGCSLTSWSPFGRDVRLAATGTGRTFTLPDPAPKVVALEVTGAGGAPLVKLTSPSGKVLDASGFGPDLTTTPDISGLLDPDNSRTVLFVRGEPGDWTIEPVEGSPSIAALAHAEILPEPKVTGTVGGAGSSRRLKYSVAKIPGQVVTFVEESAKGMRTIKTVKGGGKGTAAFMTSEGGGTARTVVAQVAQEGLPRDNVTVAKFAAPSPQAGKVRGLRARRKGSSGVATWKQGTYTAAYEITIETGDGERRLLTRAAKTRSVTFGGLSKGEGARVSVTSIAPSGRDGATSSTTLEGAKHYSSFHNKKRPPVSHKKRKTGNKRDKKS